jgi:hypothetical protein
MKDRQTGYRQSGDLSTHVAITFSGQAQFGAESNPIRILDYNPNLHQAVVAWFLPAEVAGQLDAPDSPEAVRRLDALAPLAHSAATAAVRSDVLVRLRVRSDVLDIPADSRSAASL